MLDQDDARVVSRVDLVAEKKVESNTFVYLITNNGLIATLLTEHLLRNCKLCGFKVLETDTVIERGRVERNLL